MGAVIAAVALLAIVLFGDSGGGYTVKAKFINAGQLVTGNPVQTGGSPIGSVKGIKITDDGQAEIEFEVEDDYAPLPEGTRAAIRQFSQSGIANRYIDLSFPRGAAARSRPRSTTAARSTPTRPRPRSTSTSSSTRSTRRPARRSSSSSAARPSSSANAGEQANIGFQYLNPASPPPAGCSTS